MSVLTPDVGTYVAVAVYLLVRALLAALVGRIASRKGYSFWLFAVVSFFELLGPLVVAIGLPKRAVS